MGPVPVFTGVISQPYPHYTQCVAADAYNPLNQYLQAFLQALLAGSIAGAVVSAFGLSPWCVALAAELALIAGGLGYCNWWLYDRLVCLPADVTATSGPAVDVCTVGMFITNDTPETTIIPFAVGNLDTDWTMDLVLYGMEPSAPTNVLIDEQLAISNLITKTNQSFNFDSKLSFDGLEASYTLQGVYTDSNSSYANPGTIIPNPVLHCEVEGAGVYEFKNWLTVLFWVTVGALVVQEITAGAPFVSAAISAFLALLIFLLSALGFYASENNQANPSQVPSPSQINFNSPGSPSDALATVVCVIGTWVYDSAHQGYNEIHPVKYVQQVGLVAPDAYGNIVWNPAWAGQCGMVATAITGLVATAQGQPANGWIFHPFVDGCGSYPSATPSPIQ
jgi:hypothetical protein